MKSILITGANGFLGRDLIQILDKSKYQIYTTDLIGSVDFTGDLTDKLFVKKLPEVDIIINVAAVQYASGSIPILNKRKFFKKNNVDSIINLKSKYGNSLQLFVQIGTSMMFKKNKDGVYDPNSEFNGNGYYSESKVQAFHIFRDFNCKKSLIIPSIIGGPGRAGLFSTIAKIIKKFGILILPTKSYKTSIVHVRDVSYLIQEVIDQELEGVFNASSLEKTSISDWISLIEGYLNKKCFIIKIPIFLFWIIGFLSNYNVLAKEQILMLSGNHILKPNTSNNLTWRPKKDVKTIVEETIQSLNLN